MNRSIAPAILAVCLACHVIDAGFALAEEAIPPNPMITTEYIPPALQVHSDRLKARKVLEEFTQFLSPLKLDKPLKLTTAQCDEVNASYNGDGLVTMCLEMVRHFHTDLAAFVDGKLYFDKKKKEFTRESSSTTVLLKPRLPGITRGEAAVGGFLSVFLHELGHAVFHLLEVPVLGREEHAADEIAALIMVQFGEDVAWTAIKGAAAEWDLSSQVEEYVSFPYYDEHSASLQRLGTFLCVAYGHHPARFQEMVDVGVLPPARAKSCESEYAEIAAAFNATVKPKIDDALLAKVRMKKWLRPEDFN